MYETNSKELKDCLRQQNTKSEKLSWSKQWVESFKVGFPGAFFQSNPPSYFCVDELDFSSGFSTWLLYNNFQERSESIVFRMRMKRQFLNHHKIAQSFGPLGEFTLKLQWVSDDALSLNSHGLCSRHLCRSNSFLQCANVILIVDPEFLAAISRQHFRFEDYGVGELNQSRCHTDWSSECRSPKKCYSEIGDFDGFLVGFLLTPCREQCWERFLKRFSHADFAIDRWLLCFVGLSMSWTIEHSTRVELILTMIWSAKFLEEVLKTIGIAFHQPMNNFWWLTALTFVESFKVR